MSALRKNVAGQGFSFGLVNATTGAALTGATVTAVVTKDAGAQAAATGSVTEKGGGQYWFAPSQADTNANSLGFLFTATNAIPVQVSILTTSLNPHDAAAGGMTNLDAAITSRSSHSAADAATAVRTNLTTELGRIDTNIASRSTFAGGAVASVTNPVTVGTNNDKTGYALLTSEHEAIATETEAHLLDEGDSQMLINAIVGAIGNVNMDEVALVAAIRADLERSGGHLQTFLDRLTAARAGYLDKLNVTGVLAHTDNADTFKADVSGLLTSVAYTASLPTNFSLLAINGAGAVTDADSGGGSSLTAQDVRNEVDAALAIYDAPTKAEMDAAFTGLQTHGDGAWGTATGFAVPGDAMTLTIGERNAVVSALELEIINDATGGQFMQSIADKLSEEFDIENLTVNAIAAAAASAILITPMNKLATDASGNVVASAVTSPVTTVRAIDTFVGPLDTQLQSTTPLGGGVWNRNATSTGHAVLNGNGEITCSAWNAMYFHSLVLGRNQWAAMDIRKGVTTTANQGGGPCVRVAADGFDFVTGRYNMSNGLYELTGAGMHVTLAEALPDEARLLLVAIFNDYYLFSNGELKCRGMSTTLRNVGRVGFRLFQTTGGIAQADRLRYGAFDSGEVDMGVVAAYLSGQDPSAVLAKVDTMVEQDGTAYRFTAASLTNAASVGNYGDGDVEGLTHTEALRLLLAETVGNGTGLNTENPAFYAMGGTKKRIQAASADGTQRIITMVDATPGKDE